LEASNTMLQAQTETSGKSQPAGFRFPERAQFVIYALILGVSISTWFIVIRAPLWLDETVSMFLIKGGWAGILSRQVWPDAPAYSCLLWLWTKVMGTGELMLRISSVLPMLAAVYLLYRAARGLFDQDVALVAAIVFCLHPIIIFAAIDVRPYAFAALAINATILTLVRLRHNNSNWLAALFGFLAASIVEFQLLFAAILPALAVCFIASKIGDRKTLWRQLGIALVVFTLAFLPAIPRLQYMMHTSGTHVFSEAPRLLQMISTITVRGLVIVLITFLLIAAAKRRLDVRNHSDRWTVLLCASLALVPILILYGLSVGTSIHVFVPRYRLVAVPGIALCWALVVSWMDSRVLRLAFATALVAVAACVCFTAPSFHHHMYSWKNALAFAEKNASGDNAPVLICSDLPEADHMRMPVGTAIEETGVLPPLSYYKLTVPVAPLPRALNEEAIRAGSVFLQQQAERRFLAMAFIESYGTLDWLRNRAAGTHDVRELGAFDGVKVLEFVPRSQAHDVDSKTLY
jgi:4-amino-4-deoxy-L-arabinose transferase-like glycosyltransferase